MAEILNPVRSLTSIVRVSNRPDTMVSVKSAAPIPKGEMFAIMERIHETTVEAPVSIGDVIIDNVCGTQIVATKKRPIVIGKPSPLMPQLAMEKLGVSKEETCVVGDRIYTDVKSGLNAGITGILVLSGETTREILAESPDKPHLVLEDASEILEAIRS